MEIRYVTYNEIDKAKWDACVSSAKHDCIYVLSVYLDALAQKWDALIVGDYEIIMPLIHNRKYGISYLYQPAFLPQTGIFSRNDISSDIVNAFIEEAFRRFKFAEISLRFPVQTNISGKNISSVLKNNFIADLHDNYEMISSRYTDHFTKSLRRLQKLSLQFIVADDVDEIIELFKKLYLKKTGLKEAAVDSFRTLCIQLQQHDQVIIRKVLNTENETLCAVLLLNYKNRLYNIISCVTEAGKKAEANYFLYDGIIREYAGKGMLLDLEGSNIKGIADFYLKMNPANEQYQFLKYNNLPAIVKLFKK